MASNNSKSRKMKRRQVALANFTVDQSRLSDKEYLARKEAERKVLTGSVA